MIVSETHVAEQKVQEDNVEKDTTNMLNQIMLYLGYQNIF